MSLEKIKDCDTLAGLPVPADRETPLPLDHSIEPSAVTNVNQFDPNYTDICSQIGEAIGTIGPNWLVTGCNAIFARYFGLRQDQIIGRTAFELNPNFDKSIFYPVIKQVLETGAYSSGLGYSASVSRWLYMKVYPFNGGAVGFISDATDLDSSHHQMAAVTRRDPLTGLENRLALEAYLPCSASPYL